jgi:hypothetical protein
VRIETYPLILGILVALLGIGIIFDAWTPDTISISQERRRRPRIDRHRNGEALIGFGVLALAAAFIGRDSWSYSVLVVIIGAVFLVVGAVLNRSYVRELFVNRGPLRRREVEEMPLGAGATQQERVLASDQPLDRPITAHEQGLWDGTERRSEPRDRERPRRSARDNPAEQRPRDTRDA